MASQISMTLRSKGNSTFSEPLHFRRTDKQFKTRKVKRKIKVKAKHFLIYFFFVGGFFFAVQKTYLFLISWDKLDVSGVEIQCTRPAVKEDINQFLYGKHMGNLLLLDIGTLKESLLSHPWIKDIHVRKIFPAALKIIVRERTPAALMRCESLYLIDREGEKLQKVDPEHSGLFPLLIDTDNFKDDIQAKLALAWDCLESLKHGTEKEVAVIDLSEYGNAKVKLKGSSTWIIFGSGNFKKKIDYLQARRAALNQYGSLEYIDLRFKDRLYIKPFEHWTRNDKIHTGKEAD